MDQPRIPFNSYWGSLSGVKRPGGDADHSLLLNTEVNNEWRYTSTPTIRLHRGSRDGVSLSLKRLSGEGQEGGGSFNGDPEDMLRKVPYTDISLHRGPFMAEGNMESGRGLVYRGL